MTQNTPAADMPFGTIVAATDWVAIKAQYPRIKRFQWEVAGSGVPNATDDNIDQLIATGVAKVIRYQI
jgi:hypothetical protein